jgi:hypothetical protein
MIKPIFFMHIPRCGGTTFEQVIEQAQLKTAPRMSWHDVLAESAVASFTDYEFVSGHYPMAFRDWYVPQHCVVALIRNPIDRVLSHYNYVHEHGYWRDPVYTEFCRNATLEEWLTDHISKRSASNLMTRFFAGDRYVDDLHKAIDHIETACDLVYPVDRWGGMQGFADAVCRLADIRPLFVDDRHSNQSNHEQSRQNISKDMLARITELNAKDMALYEHVLDRRKETA